MTTTTKLAFTAADFHGANRIADARNLGFAYRPSDWPEEFTIDGDTYFLQSRHEASRGVTHYVYRNVNVGGGSVKVYDA